MPLGGRPDLRLRGPNGARDEFHLAATAQTSVTRYADPGADTDGGGLRRTEMPDTVEEV